MKYIMESQHRETVTNCCARDQVDCVGISSGFGPNLSAKCAQVMVLKDQRETLTGTQKIPGAELCIESTTVIETPPP